jgi:predicted O-methyltransferase YrrM
MFMKNLIKKIFRNLGYNIYRLNPVDAYRHSPGDYGGVIDYGNQNIPQPALDYEQLYDPEFGGYREDSNNKAFITYGSVEVEVARFYYAFVNLVGAKYILETGTCHGYSSSLLAAALKRKSPEGKLFTIDIAAGSYLLQQKCLDNIEIITANSLEYTITPDMVFDILVLDSDHRYGTVMRELIKYEKYLKPGGYILMHDSLFYDGVGMAVEQLMTNPRFEAVTLESPRTHGAGTRCPGVTVVKKISDSEKFPLEFNEALALVEVNAVEGENAKNESYIYKTRKKNISAKIALCSARQNR